VSFADVRNFDVTRINSQACRDNNQFTRVQRPITWSEHNGLMHRGQFIFGQLYSRKEYSLLSFDILFVYR
jgi:hypothetical protein